MKKLFSAAITAAIMGFAQAAFAMPFAEMFPQYQDEFNAEDIEALNRLDYKQGTIKIGGGIATLEVPEGYYFLDTKDSKIVLFEFWGNIGDDVNTLGMIFPAHSTPFHNSWGVEITFDEIGYVSDEDASDYDYDEVLVEMRKDIVEENKWRVENGYETLQLVGWAEPPKYDPTARTLYWAKELSFEGFDENTLNYNIRVLGRRGVLIMNYIAPISLLQEVRESMPDVLAMPQFTEGNRYADFDPSIDQVAAVGIGGLIAGKVLAKTGIFVVILAFLKKFWFLLFIPLIWLKNLFTRR